MRQKNLIPLLAISMMMYLSGCFSPKTADQIASNHHFKNAPIKTKSFTLTSFQKLTKLHEPLTIYIEGDGRTWVTHTKLSTNPTPRNPLALKLAVLDKSDNVAYIARPCQYTPLHLDPICHPAIWSDLRFSEEVIQSMNEAIDILKINAKTKDIHLVGFSGGAAVAALVAAKRTDIATLRTVAGDLNHDALSQFHKTTPLQGSLNPMAVAHKLIHIPQQHFSGEKDPVVPTFIAEEFTKEIIKQGGQDANNIILKGVTHQQGWEQAWPTLLNMPLSRKRERVAL